MKSVSNIRAIPWRLVIMSFASGVVSVVLLLSIAYWIARWYDAGVRMPARNVQTNQELLQERADHQKEALQRNMADRERLVESIHAIQQNNPNYTVDFLILSGGGDCGAFATGFLRGWSTAPAGPLARPVFEGVSGVSTGGFMAPSAFLGTTHDDVRVDELFRNPQPDWVQRRGLLFFHPDNPSLANIPGLEREISLYVDLPFAQRLVDAGASGRQLLIQATDADEGVSHTFDCVAAARDAVASGDVTPLRNIFLASSAIPGVFSPQEIREDLFIDGIVTGNIFYWFYGGSLKDSKTFGAIWKERYPDAPIPKIRYWVIINNYLKPTVLTMQQQWIPLAQRGLEIAIRSFTEITLRHLFLFAEVNRLRGEGECEVRWVAVPPTWQPANNEEFNLEKMRSLSDLGKSMGENPDSWNDQSP
jgi:hypothetical protein